MFAKIVILIGIVGALVAPAQAISCYIDPATNATQAGCNYCGFFFWFSAFAPSYVVRSCLADPALPYINGNFTIVSGNCTFQMFDVTDAGWLKLCNTELCNYECP